MAAVPEETNLKKARVRSARRVEADKSIEEKKPLLSKNIADLEPDVSILSQARSEPKLKDHLIDNLNILDKAILKLNVSSTESIDSLEKAISVFNTFCSDFRDWISAHCTKEEQLFVANTLILRMELLALKANVLFWQAIERENEIKNIETLEKFWIALNNFDAAISRLSSEEMTDFNKAADDFSKEWDEFDQLSSEKYQSITRFRSAIYYSSDQLCQSLSELQNVESQAGKVEGQKDREEDKSSIENSSVDQNSDEEMVMKPYSVGLDTDASADENSADVDVVDVAMSALNSNHENGPQEEEKSHKKMSDDINHSGSSSLYSLDDEEPFCADVFFEAFRCLPEQSKKHPIITAGVVVIGLIALGCIYVGVTGLTHGAAAIPGAMAMGKAFSAAAPILKDCAMAISLGAAGAIGAGVGATLFRFFSQGGGEKEETKETHQHSKSLS